VYSREELPFRFLSASVAFYEMHQLRSFLLGAVMRRASGIVTISRGLKKALRTAGYPQQKILVAPDAVDEQAFSVTTSKEEARSRLGLPHDRKIALYIGGLEVWKGASTLCKAAAELEESGIMVAIIGGRGKELERDRKAFPKVRFLGERPYTELPVNQRAGDVLIVPNSGETRLGSEFTSPLKLFAHLHSEAPIVASDVPALRETIGSDEAFFFVPDDVQSLAEAVKLALSDGGDARRRAAAAKQKAALYTWEARAKSILEFMKASNGKQG
jgi:glycosyltransferase involved in cell wall biosynthesis